MKKEMDIQRNPQILRQLYISRVFGLVLIFAICFLLANVLLNYLVLIFLYAFSALQSAATLQAPASLLSYFSFRANYIVTTPSQIPFWVPLVLSAIMTVFQGWKIIMKIEKAKMNINMDYSAKDIEGSSRWATDKDNKKNLTQISKAAIDEARLGGIILTENQENYFADTKITNSLVVGKTRSGKGVYFILPTARYMAMCKEKISLVVTDPKIENYELLYSTLKENGYRIWLINYRDPEKGLGCNNLYPLIREYKKAMEASADERDFSKAAELVKEFAYMHTMNAKSDPVWPESAQALLEAMLFYLLDIGYERQTIDQLNMYTVRVFFTDKGTKEVTLPGKGRTVELDLIFQGLPLESNARQLYATSKFAEGEMRSSIFATLSSNLSIYADAGLAKMTSSSEIDFRLLSDPARPTALFLGVPDDKKSRHKLAAITIKQIYTELVDLSQQNKNNLLPRRVCIMADEIGNMPPFPDLDNMLQVSLGRNIMWHLYVQNLAQLNKVYGENEARIIRDSVSNLVYILSADPVTNKDISDMLGCETKTYQTTTGDHGSFLVADHVQGHVKGRPLLTPQELMLLQEGEIVVIKDRCYPILSKREPFYNLKIPRTELKDTSIILSDNMRNSALLMSYEDTAVAEDSPEEKPNYERPIFSAAVQSDPDREIDFALSCKMHSLTKSAFLDALYSSNYAKTRALVQDKKDLSELSTTEAESLFAMIDRYEAEERAAATNTTKT